MIRAFNQALFYSLLSILSFVTFSTYAGLENVVTPKKVFTVLSIYTVARLYYSYFVGVCTLGISEIWVSIKRIEVSTSSLLITKYLQV